MRDIRLHCVYAVKVSGQIVPVQIDRQEEYYHYGRKQWRTRWHGVSQRTGKSILILSPQRLRGLWSDYAKARWS